MNEISRLQQLAGINEIKINNPSLEYMAKKEAKELVCNEPEADLNNPDPYITYEYWGEDIPYNLKKYLDKVGEFRMDINEIPLAFYKTLDDNTYIFEFMT